MRRLPLPLLLLTCAAPLSLTAQNPPSAPRQAGSAVTATSILAPRTPLPAEAASAGVTRFSFIAYGDTRGRNDGVSEQYEHSLVVQSMLQTIRSMQNGPDPVRFVLQSGDAVVNGRDVQQWNVSFVSLINRITTEGGVPYFLVPGNHDVTGAEDVEDPARQMGLGNYLRVVSQLIPPNNSTRRLNGYPTFSFGYGNTFVIAFDSNIPEDTTQLSWVRSQLQSLDRKRYTHVVAFCHHPVYSSGPHGGATIEKATAGLRARYMPLFRKYNVELLLTGHDHVFEHWVERYRGTDGKSHRIDEIVSGGGGAPPYAHKREAALPPHIARAPGA